MRRPPFIIQALALLWIAYPMTAHSAPSDGILNHVTQQFYTQTTAWAGTLTGYASTLFVMLGTISLAWTGGVMILRRADIGEFFAEFVRFILFFGFFLWLLQHAPAIGGAIVHSFIQMGADASNSGVTNPSAIVDIGFGIFHKVMEQSSVLNPTDSIIGALLAGIILICLALIAANMTILLCSAWILLYGGIFFLGFGGSRWTSEIAINYYKSIISTSASLMAMVLMVGVAQNIIADYYNQMSAGLDVQEIATVMVVAIILLLLVHRIPGLIGGILSGASVGHSGIGTFGYGAALGTMSNAYAIASSGAAMAIEGGRNLAGTHRALQAAYASAQQKAAQAPAKHETNSPIQSLTSAVGDSMGFIRDMGKSLSDAAKAVEQSSVSPVDRTYPGKLAAHIRNTTPRWVANPAPQPEPNPAPQASNTNFVSAGTSASQDEIQAFVDKYASGEHIL